MKQGARLVLPFEERSILCGLSGEALRARARELHAAGWSLASIGNAFDPPKQRSTVRAWVMSTPPHPAPHTQTLPSIPAPPSSLSSLSSLSSISSASSIITAGEKSAFTFDPSVSAKQGDNRKRRRVYDPSNPRVTQVQKRKIAHLAPLARRYRARTSPNGTYARANQELTELCKDLYRTGASVRELSKAAGVTYRAMARRIGK
jgi:hypothetical protein